MTALRESALTPIDPGYGTGLVNRTLQIHAWLLAALLIGVLVLLALLVLMLHVHAGDVAYIAHTHRPVIVVPNPGPIGIST
jgi:hypothetical protein